MWVNNRCIIGYLLCSKHLKDTILFFIWALYGWHYHLHFTNDWTIQWAQNVYDSEYSVLILGMHCMPGEVGWAVHKARCVPYGSLQSGWKTETNTNEISEKTTRMATIKHQVGWCKLLWKVKKRAVRGHQEGEQAKGWAFIRGTT